MEVGLIVFAGFLGSIISWVEARFGLFENQTPRFKQTFNAVMATVIPGLVVWLGPIWSPELGEISATLPVWLQGVAPLVAAGVAWFMSQVAHYADMLFAKFAK